MYNSEKDKEAIEINITEIFEAIFSKLWVVILAAVLFGGIAFLYAFTQLEPTYSSTAELLILAKNKTTGLSSSDVSLSTSLTQDYREIIISRTILNNAITELNLDISYNHLKNSINITNPTNSRVLKITVTTDKPEDCKLIVDKICELSSIAMAIITDVDQVYTIDTGSSPDINTPSILKYTAIGALLGLVASCGIIVLCRILDDRIKSPDEVEKYLGLSVLGMIPNYENAASDSKKVE